MPLFSKIFKDLDMTDRAKPKSKDDRIRRLEEDVMDLRSAMRELVKVLEREFDRDIDKDGTVGKVSPKRGLPTTARLRPEPRPSALKRRSPPPLPPRIP